MSVFSIFKITCREASYLASKREEVALDSSERWKLRIHLWFCTVCARFARQVDLLHFTMEDLPGKEGPSFSEERKRAMENKLKEEGSPL